MGKTTRIINNSSWLILQSLVLNVVSLFAMGFIARRLGKSAYGQFIFGLGFISIFIPFTNLGLRAFTVRSIAQDKSVISTVISNMLGTRLIMSIITMIAVIMAAFLLGYDSSKIILVTIYSSSLIFTSIASTYQDAFQALESMSYVALIQLLSGIVVTIASVYVVYLGMGPFGLISTYLFAAVFGAMLSLAFYTKHVGKAFLHVDYEYAKKNIIESAPFFWPNLVCLSGSKIGLIFLASMSGDVSVGLYGAANNLVEKLIVIPDSLCTAFFPAMSASFRQSPEEASFLFKRFYRYLVVLGLPIAVGTTILARQIINAIFGSNYVGSAAILQILIWSLYISFLTTLKFWTNGAIHKEKIGGYIAITGTVAQVLCGLVLVPRWGGQGLAFSNLVSTSITFVLLRVSLRDLTRGVIIEPAMLVCIIVSNIAMGSIAYILSSMNLLLVVVACIIIYITLIIILRVITRNELTYIKTRVRKKLGLIEP